MSKQTKNKKTEREIARQFSVLEMDMPVSEEKRFRVMRFFATTVDDAETVFFREVYTGDSPITEEEAYDLACKLNRGEVFHVFGRDELRGAPSIVKTPEDMAKVAAAFNKAMNEVRR